MQHLQIFSYIILVVVFEVNASNLFKFKNSIYLNISILKNFNFNTWGWSVI